MLNWTHDPQYCALHAKGECDETTDCAGFPTVHDRVNHAHAAFEAYAEADGNDLTEFLQDVALLAWARDIYLTTMPFFMECARYREEQKVAKERSADAHDEAHS